MLHPQPPSFFFPHRVSYVFRAVANVTCLGAMEFRVRELQTSRFVHIILFLLFVLFCFFYFCERMGKKYVYKSGVQCSAVQCTFPQGRLNRLDSSSSPLSLGGFSHKNTNSCAMTQCLFLSRPNEGKREREKKKWVESSSSYFSLFFVLLPTTTTVWVCM